jgi:integral membrane protein
VPDNSPQISDVPGARSRLTFFKVMAFIVGVGLLVLVVEMVLSYGFGMKGDDNPLHWWPQPHGFIYMVYLVATALLGFKVGWSLPKMVGVMLAGCVPFLSFWVERKVAREVEAQMATTGSVSA